MTDRILNRAWWFAVMAMICAAMCLTLLSGYRGALELLAGRAAGGAVCLAVGVASAVGVLQLCRYRNDLL